MNKIPQFRAEQMLCPYRIARLVLALLCAGPLPLRAQEFKLFGRPVQVHGWFAHGFAYSIPEVRIPFGQ